MGCHVYIRDIKTRKTDFDIFLRVPPVFYDTKFKTEEEVKHFVKMLRTGTYGCNSGTRDAFFKVGTDCCNPICHEQYGKFKPSQVNWILKKFREGKNYVECG